MKPYKISQDIDLYQEENYLRVGDKIHNLQEVKNYLLTYHESLCRRFKIRTYMKGDFLHITYSWDSIFFEAHRRFILQNLFRYGR